MYLSVDKISLHELVRFSTHGGCSVLFILKGCLSLAEDQPIILISENIFPLGSKVGAVVRVFASQQSSQVQFPDPASYVG